MSIKLLRVAKGFSQAQLAALLGVNQTAVSQWERGTSRPRASTLKRLAALLETTVDKLLEDESAQKPIGQ